MSHNNGIPAHPSIFRADQWDSLLAALTDKRDQRIIFTNGCYDILHPGHVDLLARCKAKGDILILGLNSDDSVRSLGKGDNRPVNTFAVRAYVLAHLASIDYVVEFNESTPLELIDAVRPDVLIKGGDWGIDSIVGKDIVESDGGEVLSLPLLHGFSTTSLIEKICSGC
ncbi:adenylyltransferase/cytidyltransferase family protein [Halodesulfovibrio sp.]|jgi:rfaE bifunctional protein nucleotidyltransferase chain/domain|uniref:adenylyltransferase/cytidyltransferase family protein n=1 Tax=Halodesulfovibrio sp. TaxID=1912772 RepID=UPI0025F94B6F|nr:adenylyltransferase/cytidyltransferase family protein [Halodesulfovibrio sp.]MCT4534251.1 adenylyltransferase/cytidyltransferase family protein [Halodesulfovibrio sp.]